VIVVMRMLLGPVRGEGDGTRRRSAWMLIAAEGKAVPGPWAGLGESRTSDDTQRRLSWGGGSARRGEAAWREPHMLEDGLGDAGAEDDCDDAPRPRSGAGEDEGCSSAAGAGNHREGDRLRKD
jgi:hypothetical protein